MQETQASNSSGVINNFGKVEIAKCVPTYVWTVSNFCTCHQRTGEALKSPTFFLGHNNDLKWSIHLYPKGFEKKYADYVSIFLQYEDDNQSDVVIKYKFSLVDSKGQHKNEVDSETERLFSNGCDWGFREFITRERLFELKNGLLPDNRLTVSCEIDVVKYKYNLFQQPPPAKNISFLDGQSKLLNDFDGLFKSKMLSDVTLIVEEKKFHAHKAILASRSSVFSAMFKHNMQEQQANIVQIVDFSAPVVKEVLRFAYSGRVEDLTKHATDILPAAEKYAMEDLKMLCLNTIEASLDIDNVGEILVLADKYNATSLKKTAMDFIIMHGDKVTDTDGFWIHFMSEPNLITEVFQIMAAKCSTSFTKGSKRDVPNKKRKSSDSNRDKQKST